MVVVVRIQKLCRVRVALRVKLMRTDGVDLQLHYRISGRNHADVRSGISHDVLALSTAQRQ